MDKIEATTLREPVIQDGRHLYFSGGGVMKLFIGLSLTIGLSLAIGLGVTGTAQASNCGDMPYWSAYNIKVHKTTCKRGRQVAARYSHHGSAPRGWKCEAEGTGIGEVFDLTCKSRKRRVHWRAGTPDDTHGSMARASRN